MAAWLGARLERSLGAPSVWARSLRTLRADLCVVATDCGRAATLRFDHGVVTLLDGLVGLPALTLCGDRAELARLLGDRRAAGRAPTEPGDATHWPEVATGSAVVQALANGELRVHGGLTHPWLLTRLLWLLRASG